jgi:GR25 family glycosyltransferase involved in LPS biosynthesis
MCIYPIYCINLISRPDRKEYVTEQFKKLDIDNVIFLPLTKHSKGGIYGCHDSHIKVWNHFLENYPNQKFFLIFEDDFLPVDIENCKDIMNKAATFINDNYQKIDLLFLHNYCVVTEDPLNNDTFTKGYGVCTHAYFITRPYLENLIYMYDSLPEPDGRNIDVSMNFNMTHFLYSENIFFTKQKCYIQLEIESDIVSDVLDTIIKLNYNKSLTILMKTLTLLKKRLFPDNFIKNYYCKIEELKLKNKK